MKQLFETRRSYAVAFGAYALSLLSVSRALVKRRAGLPVNGIGHPSFVNIAVAAFCMIFFLSMLWRTRNALERIAIVISASFFALWCLDTLAAYGQSWASVPDSLMISVGICAVATAIAGVRLLQDSKGGD